MGADLEKAERLGDDGSSPETIQGEEELETSVEEGASGEAVNADAIKPAANGRSNNEALKQSPNAAPTTPLPSSPPDGGFQAWLQVFGSFCLFFNTWGLTASFGTFQAIYETNQLRDHSAFQISVIGSLQIFLMVFLGIVAGPLYDAGYFRHLLAVGSFLIFAGSLIQSFCVYYWQFVLVQGIMVGTGCGCLCLLGTAFPSLWFTSRLPLANGLAATGSGVGGVILPIMVREVNARAGLGWATRSLAFVTLFLLVLANIILRQPPSAPTKRKARAIIDVTALKDVPFLIFVMGCFAFDLGIYTPFVHVQPYALKNAIADPRISLYILAIANVGGIVGRVLPILLARRLGSMNLSIITIIALTATGFGLLSAKTLPQLLVAMIVFGFFMGTLFALMPTIFVRLTPDPKVIGTRFGMAFATMSIGMLFGPPIAGVFVDAWDYYAAWIWSGSTIAAGGCLVVVARIVKIGPGISQVI